MDTDKFVAEIDDILPKPSKRKRLNSLRRQLTLAKSEAKNSFKYLNKKIFEVDGALADYKDALELCAKTELEISELTGEDYEPSY